MGESLLENMTAYYPILVSGYPYELQIVALRTFRYSKWFSDALCDQSVELNCFDCISITVTNSAQV